jgi:hypothetical protein
MVEQLRSAKMLRFGADIEPELLDELFAVAAGKSTCPDCEHVGLTAAAEDTSAVEWPGGRPCELCGGVISRERLRVLPSTKRCASCQHEQESGDTSGDADYCPRCGSIRQLRPTRSGGVTHYAMFCPACHR